MRRSPPPYAEFLGLSVAPGEDGTRTWSLPFGDRVLGRPGFLHGGAIAGLLEVAALDALQEALSDDDPVQIKPINISISYLRGGANRDTHAGASILRLGNRVASVEAEAWQQDREKPIASARMNVLLRRKDTT